MTRSATPNAASVGGGLQIPPAVVRAQTVIANTAAARITNGSFSMSDRRDDRQKQSITGNTATSPMPIGYESNAAPYAATAPQNHGHVNGERDSSAMAFR